MIVKVPPEDLHLLWNEVDLTHDDKFSFNTARVLESVWCKQHGAEYLNDILAAD